MTFNAFGAATEIRSATTAASITGEARLADENYHHIHQRRYFPNRKQSQLETAVISHSFIFAKSAAPSQ